MFLGAKKVFFNLFFISENKITTPDNLFLDIICRFEFINVMFMNKAKKPWPTKDAMEQVYEMNLWGGHPSSFYSGMGSHDPKITIPYITALTTFLTSFKDPLIVCDLGCGDFNIGKELVSLTKKYIAIDIVTDLIVYNRKHFKQENLEFHCLDIATDNIPNGDCAIIRQVLQHLSNTEILSILKKLSGFKYIIVTEHLPEGNFIPNKDIISGQGIRLKKQSGIDLLVAPFNFKIKEKKQLVSFSSNSHKGIIITTLYTLF